MVRLKETNRGFSLIELLIFIAILSGTFVAIIGAITYGIYAQTNAKMRQNALHLNSELFEFLRVYRSECGYANLVLKSNPETTYCFADIDYAIPVCTAFPSAGDCSSNSVVDNVFKRSATFSMITNDNTDPVADDVYVSVKITTTWPMGEGTNSVVNTTYFSNYE